MKTPSQQRDLRRRIGTFAERFIAALSADQVPLPQNGDCWHCLIRTGDRTVGEAQKYPEHLESHLREDYFVPSLLTRAVELFPVPSMVAEYMNARMYVASGRREVIPGESEAWWEELAEECVPKLVGSLKKYIGWQFGLTKPPKGRESQRYGTRVGDSPWRARIVERTGHDPSITRHRHVSLCREL